jgi:iron complex outermembrane recepter protein
LPLTGVRAPGTEYLMLPTESRRLWRALLKLVAMGSLLCSHGALAASPDQPLRIDLPAGPLQQALEQLADLAQLQILYDPDLVRGQVTRGLHAKLTPARALSQLLASTDIAFEFTAADAVALHARSRPNAPAPPGSPDVAAQVRTVTITADRNRELRANNELNVTSVKIDEPSLVVPVAATTLPHEFLRDRQAIRLEDVVEFVSGTETVPDGESSSGFEIRGFPTYQYYLDGVRVSPDLHHDGFRDFADVERVDILKGPASLLYGRTEPGGLINIITKKPLEEPMLALEQQVGSFDLERTQLDAGGPLSPGGSLLYRFNAAWQNSASFRDIPESHRVFVAPVVTWKASDRTALTGYLEYLNSRDPSDSGLPLIGDRLPLVPMSRSVDEGGQIHTTDLRIGTEASHAFADGWTMSTHLDARWLHAPQSPQVALAADGLVPIQCNVIVCPVDRQLVSIPTSRGYTYYASVDAARDFNFWHMRHSVLADIEFFQTGAYSEWDSASAFSLTGDLYHPSTIPIPVALLENPDQKTQRNTGERWTAAFVQDQIELGSRLYLLLGLRWDEATARSGQTVYSPQNGGSWSPYFINSARVHALKQREGVVWRALPWLSLYAKYSENFGATPGLYVGADGSTGIFLPQQSANEWESGLKVGLADDRIAGTLAFFSLTKQNIASPLLEPALDPSGFLFLTGTARNRGVEVDVHGEVLSGLQILASYAYIDSRISNLGFSTVGNGTELMGTTGNRLFGVPRNGGSVWMSYRFSGGLRGLKAGIGGIARGAREGDNANDYVLPGFVKWNTFAAYAWRTRGLQLSAQLNIDNVFNKSYLESLSGTRTVMPEPPRRFLASLRVEF